MRGVLLCDPVVAVSVRGFDFRLIDTAQSALLSRSVCYNLISPVTPTLFLNCTGIW